MKLLEFTQTDAESNNTTQLSNEKRPGCLGDRGDYTTQVCRDYV